MKDRKLFIESNVAELAQQFEAALEKIKENILKHGPYASHSVSHKIDFTYNAEQQCWENSVTTAVACAQKTTMHGPKIPVKVDSKGVYDADPQLKFPTE